MALIDPLGGTTRKRISLALELDWCEYRLAKRVHVHGFVFVDLVVRVRDEDPTDEAPLGEDPLDQLICEQACRDGLHRLPSETAEGRWWGVVRRMVVQ